MQKLSFVELQHKLLAAGAAPSVIDRIIQELREHCDDAAAAAVASGHSASEARRLARSALGSADTIAAAVAAQPELLDWRHRWPGGARTFDGLLRCLVWPVAPFVYCCAHPAPIVRWSVSSGVAACITAMLLFAMQWLIPSAVWI